MLLGKSLTPSSQQGESAPLYSGGSLEARASDKPTHESFVKQSPGSIDRITVEFSIVHRILSQMKESQDRQELRLASFIQGQSQSSTSETGYSSNKDIAKVFERFESRLDEILRKMDTCREKHDGLASTAADEVQPVEGVEVGYKTSEAMGVEGHRLAATRGNAIHDKIPDSVGSDGTAKDGIDEEVPQVKNAEWTRFKQDVLGHGHHHSRVYKDLMRSIHKEESVWHHFFRYLGLSSCLATESPKSFLVEVTVQPWFVSVSEFLVFANACLIGYETDNEIKVALQQPGAQHIAWMPTCNLMFNIIFSAEVAFRILALGTWFFVSPDEWAWNFFDVIVVSLSLLSDLMSGMNLSFLRSFRLLRVVRAVRIIRVLRTFRDLRKMLLAMLASLRSLFWVFVFLLLLMFMISILLLQSLAVSLVDMQEPAEYATASSLVLPFYGSMGSTMFSLLLAFTGGTDWFTVYQPLEVTDRWIQGAFVLFILFILVGIMNILTGIFLANAAEAADRDLLIQDYCIKTEDFVKMMLDIFSELDLDRTGDVTKETFLKAVDNDAVQAYMASYGLNPLHAHLIFDLLDERCTGKVKLFDFVFGMSRLKGTATAADAKVIMNQVGMVPDVVASTIAHSRPHASA